MRTTITLPDALLSQAKKRAREAGIGLSDLVASAVRDRVLRHTQTAPGAPFRLVEFGEGGLLPGVAWGQMKQVADTEDQARLGMDRGARAADGK